MGVLYQFKPVDTCAMCGAGEDQRILGRRLNQTHGWAPHRVSGVATTIVRCGACGLVYSNPLPIPNDVCDHYNIPAEQYWPEDAFVIEGLFTRELEILSQLAGPLAGLKALDIGSGVGRGLRVMESRGIEAYGLEPSPSFCNAAIERMGIMPERLITSPLETASLEPASFDFINFSGVLEHVYDPSAALATALKWTKLGGLLHVEVPSSRWLVSKLANLYFRACGTDLVTHLSPMHKPFHLFEFAAESFERNGRTNGYFVARRDYEVCTSYNVPAFAGRILYPLMKATNSGMMLSVWLVKGRVAETAAD